MLIACCDFRSSTFHHISKLRRYDGNPTTFTISHTSGRPPDPGSAYAYAPDVAGEWHHIPERRTTATGVPQRGWESGTHVQSVRIPVQSRTRDRHLGISDVRSERRRYVVVCQVTTMVKLCRLDLHSLGLCWHPIKSGCSNNAETYDRSNRHFYHTPKVYILQLFFCQLCNLLYSLQGIFHVFGGKI